jgi:hypothetical protein
MAMSEFGDQQLTGEDRNAPDTTLSRRSSGAPILLTVGLTFGRVDKQPTIRQLHPIAELGKPADQPTRAPGFMRLLSDPFQSPDVSLQPQRSGHRNASRRQEGAVRGAG